MIPVSAGLVSNTLKSLTSTDAQPVNPRRACAIKERRAHMVAFLMKSKGLKLALIHVSNSLANELSRFEVCRLDIPNCTTQKIVIGFFQHSNLTWLFLVSQEPEKLSRG